MVLKVDVGEESQTCRHPESNNMSWQVPRGRCDPVKLLPHPQLKGVDPLVVRKVVVH